MTQYQINVDSKLLHQLFLGNSQLCGGISTIGIGFEPDTEITSI